jgi:hypothetical protein
VVLLRVLSLILMWVFLVCWSFLGDVGRRRHGPAAHHHNNVVDRVGDVEQCAKQSKELDCCSTKKNGQISQGGSADRQKKRGVISYSSGSECADVESGLVGQIAAVGLAGSGYHGANECRQDPEQVERQRLLVFKNRIQIIYI